MQQKCFTKCQASKFCSQATPCNITIDVGDQNNLYKVKNQSTDSYKFTLILFQIFIFHVEKNLIGLLNTNLAVNITEVRKCTVA